MFAALGYSAISLPALLSEVYQHVCPVPAVTNATLLDARNRAMQATEAVPSKSTGVKRTIRIGIVAGSFDNIPGRIMIGILESMSSRSRQGVRFAAMCFATPRDATTDRVNGLFDEHINLAANNKALITQRIRDFGADIILFADAALDSRVFALAHERLALYQGVIWHWGGTLGIPTFDFYVMPEMFWQQSQCAVLHRGPVPPQSLFTEQVVLLEGLPYVSAQSPAMATEEVRAILQTRYLLPVNNQTHIYVFPGSVKHLHPEFDRAIDVILRTDPLALIVLAMARSGRDNVPPTHIAVRHDLMHPSQPAAAVAKCLRRLRARVGVQNIDRVRVLPPVDETILRGLQHLAVAVLDPFPVGMHLPVLQAMLDQVPVLSAFALQECTNSHAFNFARFLNLTSSIESRGRSTASSSGVTNSNTDNFESHASPNSAGATDNFLSMFPTTPEEYGVWAVRLQREPQFREAFIFRDRRALVELVKASRSGPQGHGEQLLQFVRTLLA
jgi:predicted O-linked N-acetylglucosamine transferase (SPINDLY family)